MAITRNASESNETMIFGLDLKAGDEVIFTTQNYPRMRNAWTQRQRRDGIVLKPVKIEASLAFMVESCWPYRPTAWALERAQPDYDMAWAGFPKAQLP